MPAGRVLAIFLVRAALIGLMGAGLGFAGGWLGSWIAEERLSSGGALGARFDVRLLALVLVLTPLLSALAGWLPAFWASRLDPAESLREK